MDRAREDMLIGQAQSGDRRALNALVAEHQERAYRYAYRLTRNQDDASDVVADAFVRISTAIKTFRGQSGFGTWLYRIITNCALDRKKKQKRHRHLSLDASQSTEEGEVKMQVEDEGPSPQERAESTEREAKVQQALDEMPEYQKAMLILYHVEQLSYEQIAETLDLPLGTVKSRLNRARAALRDHLAVDMELFQFG